MQQHFAEVMNRLREQGYRLTVQRQAVLHVLVEADSHPTAEEIHQQLVDEFPMLSLATVYKVIHVLKELGVITEIRVEGATRYDLQVSIHPHLVCVQCHTIIDLSPDLMPTLPEEPLLESGFHPLWQQVVIYGLCPRCQAEEVQT